MASPFQGMDTATLQASLTSAQAAYLALSMGSKAEQATYTQGDGSKSVVFTRTNIAQLLIIIGQLKEALGIVPRSRRPIRFLYW